MILKYFSNLSQKPTHQRRVHAERIAGVVTALVAVLWLGTLGATAVVTDDTTIASETNQNFNVQNQVAAVGQTPSDVTDYSESSETTLDQTVPEQPASTSASSSEYYDEAYESRYSLPENQSN